MNLEARFENHRKVEQPTECLCLDDSHRNHFFLFILTMVSIYLNLADSLHMCIVKESGILEEVSRVYFKELHLYVDASESSSVCCLKARDRVYQTCGDGTGKGAL